MQRKTISSPITLNCYPKNRILQNILAVNEAQKLQLGGNKSCI